MKTNPLKFWLLIVILSLPSPALAQFYQEWSYDLPPHVRHVPLSDNGGNFYFITWDWGAPFNTLNKLNSDGTAGWQVGFTDRLVGSSTIILDREGNVIIPVDSTPIAPGGGYEHLLSYLKYSPSGSLIANPSVFEPLTAYFDSPLYGVNVDSAGNVLLAGVEAEWITYTYEGNEYTGAFGHLRLTFMNDAGVISQAVLDQGADWTFDGLSGQILGPDLNNEFLVRYTNKSGSYPSISYTHYLVRCSSSSGVIWKREITSGDRPLLGLSGSIYRASAAGITKRDRMDNLEWTYANPIGYNAATVYENPIDSSVIDVLLPTGGGNVQTLICLEQDGSVRWRDSVGRFLGFARDGNLLAQGPDTTLLQISSVDGKVINSSSGIQAFGQTLTDTLGNIFMVSRAQIVKLSPLPTLTVLDANRDTLSETEMYLIRVAGDAPQFTLDTLDIVRTNADGKIPLTPINADSFTVDGVSGVDTLVIGDTLKLATCVFAEPSVKHTNLPLSKYSVHLDNWRFDSSGALILAELTGGDHEIILGHSEFRFNLVVSVEWDATVEYLNSIERSFRNLSNYLYDVTDGQMRLDTVMIYDDQDHWLDADVRIRASNVQWPEGAINGSRLTGLGDVITLPRKWYGDGDDTRNGSYFEPQPLDFSTSANFRQIAHELGHYLFGFDEEYEFADGLGRCGAISNYGVMDYPYSDGGVYSSEMSDFSRYTGPNCQNTFQYRRYLQSCWGQFESDFEGRYGADSIFVAINTPTELGAAPFTGPNDDLSNLDYDVGVLAQFPVTHNGPSAFTLDVVTHDWQLNQLPGIDVALRHPTGGGSYYEMYQGRSSDLNTGMTPGGGIYVLGAQTGDLVIASSDYTITGIASPARGLSGISAGNWLVGQATVGAPGDSLTVTLHPIEGAFPLIPDVEDSSDSLALSLVYATPFSSPPTLEVAPMQGGAYNYTFADNGTTYRATLTDTLGASGALTVWAADNANSAFFFTMRYQRATLDSASTHVLTGPQGLSVFRMDSSVSGARDVTLLSSPYPPLREGLATIAHQVGYTCALSVSSSSFTGELSLGYNDADLVIDSAHSGAETSIQMYRWSSSGWVALGGVVDTRINVVRVSVTRAGVYAAFVSDISTDVTDNGDNAPIPYDFQLAQNYPNPFNPSTTIEYSLPVRSHVIVTVYNLLGQRIRTLIDENKSAGTYQAVWNSDDESGATVASGVYLYRFETDNHSQTKKMMLIK